MFVLAAHTFCSCVKATCKGNGGGGDVLGLFTLLPVLVSPIGIPVLLTAAGLCVYCMYMTERCLWKMDADSTLVVPQAVAFFDRGDSWPPSLCPSLCVRTKHM